MEFNNRYSISIIIPTYNGAHKILNLLHSLEKQSYKDFEVIIVIDGSTDQTKEIVEKNTFNFQSLKIIEQSNQGRSVVRNTGANAASGDLLIFFDDDMILTEDCLLKHIEHHHKHEGCILTGGLSEDPSKSNSDIQRYKAFLSTKWSLPLQTFQEKPLTKENIFITAANFSISKKVFFDLNGFDDQLRDAEDYDLAVRAFVKNIPLYYDHQAFAWHNDQITCLSYIKRQREYKIMHQKLLLIKPALYKDFPLRNIVIPKGIKGLVFKIFAFKFWIWTIDHFNWLMLLPQNLRYKIYDLVITSNGVFYPKKVKL